MKNCRTRTLRVCVSGGGRRWWEDYPAECCSRYEWWDGGEIETEEDGERWGERLIAWFNETLRPGERPRRFLWSELVEENER